MCTTTAPWNLLWQFKTDVFTCSGTHVDFTPGPPWPVKRCQQTLKLVYITHTVIAKYFNLTTLMTCHDTLKHHSLSNEHPACSVEQARAGLRKWLMAQRLSFESLYSSLRFFNAREFMDFFRNFEDDIMLSYSMLHVHSEVKEFGRHTIPCSGGPVFISIFVNIIPANTLDDIGTRTSTVTLFTFW